MGKIQLNRSYKYFYQIQGQMFCTQLRRVDFVVYFDNKFHHKLSVSSEGLLFLNCSPAGFREVKNCINMVSGRTNKKRKNSYFNNDTS